MQNGDRVHYNYSRDVHFVDSHSGYFDSRQRDQIVRCNGKGIFVRNLNSEECRVEFRSLVVNMTLSVSRDCVTKIETSEPDKPVKFKETTPSRSKLTIGSDPEFVFYSPINSQLIPADDAFHLRRSHTDNFGYDGETTLAELRPKHCKNPISHVKNIRRIFKQAEKNYPNAFELYLIGSDSRTGGHVHFGHNHLRSPRIKNEAIKRLTSNLDYLLSFPLMFCETPSEAIIRKRDRNYGLLNNCRCQPWGMEYRTPPSWLGSEKMATSVLCLSYIIAIATLDKNYIVPVKKVFKCSDTGDIDNDFNHHQVNRLKQYLPAIQSQITSLPLFKKYKEPIRFLLKNARTQNNILSTEIKWGWGLKPSSITNFNLLPLKATAHKLASCLTIPTNTDFEANFSTIQYNNRDYRVKKIHQAVSFAINETFKKSEQEKIGKVKIYGLKEGRGNVVKISTRLSVRNIIRLKKLIQKLTSLVPEEIGSTKLEIKQGDTERIGLGRPLRRSSLIACSTVILAYILIKNPTLYQSSGLDVKTGKIEKSNNRYTFISTSFLDVLEGKKDQFTPLPTPDDGEKRNFSVNLAVIKRLNLAPLVNNKPLSKSSYSSTEKMLKGLVIETKKEKTSSNSLDIIREWRAWQRRPELRDLARVLNNYVGLAPSYSTRKSFANLTAPELRHAFVNLHAVIDRCFSQGLNHFQNLHREPRGQQGDSEPEFAMPEAYIATPFYDSTAGRQSREDRG